MSKNEGENQNRTLYLDMLKIVFSYFVIVAHVSAQHAEAFSTDSWDFRIFDLFNSFSNMAPGMFLLVSGAIFLDPNFKGLTIKKLYSKYLLRLIAAYILWSNAYTFLAWYGHYTLSLETVRLFIIEFFKGAPMYHMRWFMPVIIALYALLPILRPAFADKKVCRYYMILYFVIHILIPTLLIFDFRRRYMLDGIYSRFTFIIGAGYLGLFVMGYYLKVEDFTKKQRILLYALAVLTLGGGMVVDWTASAQRDETIRWFVSMISLGSFFTLSAVFVWFKHIPWKEGKAAKFAVKLSRLTFGIYLVHPMIMEHLVLPYFINLSIPEIIWIPLVSLITFIDCVAVAYVLSLIPVVKKYLM